MKDFHVHEHHSGDARAAPVEGYCRIAEEKGVDEIGFATHLIIAGPHVRFGVQPNLIPEYFEEIEAAQASTKIKLRVGLEVDYFPEEERRLASILDEYPFDFILGSLHYIQGYDTGSKDGFAAYSNGKRIEDVLNGYYDIWKKGVESGLFDIMAHPDYFRRPLYQINPSLPTFDSYGSTVFEAIDSLKSYGVGVEVNTSGYKHGVEDCYPILGFLKAVKEGGVETVTIGSDSHALEQLGMRLDKAVKRLEEAGYDHISIFSGRKSRSLGLIDLFKKT
jgi:histidinol-phosphatase (PHP family)